MNNLEISGLIFIMIMIIVVYIMIMFSLALRDMKKLEAKNMQK